MILKRSICECITGAYWVRQCPNKSHLEAPYRILTHSAHKLPPQHYIAPNSFKTRHNHDLQTTFTYQHTKRSKPRGLLLSMYYKLIS